jgi:hypothetical protein
MKAKMTKFIIMIKFSTNSFIKKIISNDTYKNFLLIINIYYFKINFM